ncbi:unnamed protein product [Rodentolepis nana]|uniref:Amidase domain-containing protein n=1 Tax=Rodentolepis nana TaxID=102285 RepID=A0A0R3TF10_RODNA|nr:unnamed protein product [Rodentolepis nana]
MLQLVEWTPPFKVKAYLDLFLKSIFCDGCAFLKTLLANDKIDPCMQVIYGLSIAPWYHRLWLRTKMHWTGDWVGLAVLNSIRGFSSVEQLESHILRIKEFRNRVMDSLRSESIDVILCPVAGFAVALPLRPSHSTTGMLAFQNLANTLGIPAGTMPSGCVVEKRDIEVLRQAVEGKEIKAAMDNTEENFYTGYGNLSPLHRNMLPLGFYRSKAMQTGGFANLRVQSIICAVHPTTLSDELWVALIGFKQSTLQLGTAIHIPADASLKTINLFLQQLDCLCLEPVLPVLSLVLVSFESVTSNFAGTTDPLCRSML